MLTKWQSDELTKWPVDKMTSWQNNLLTKWPVDKMTNWQNDQLTKCPVDKMMSWQNDTLTQWWVDKMTAWQIDYQQIFLFTCYPTTFKNIYTKVLWNSISSSLSLRANKLERFSLTKRFRLAKYLLDKLDSTCKYNTTGKVLHSGKIWPY